MEQNMLLFCAVCLKGNIYIFLCILLKFKIINIAQKLGEMMGYLYPKIPDV